MSMMLRFRIVFCFAFVLSCKFSDSQNIHFSQYDAPQTFLNPSLTGSFDGDWRAGLSFREQWRSIADPYQSTIAFYDHKFKHYSRSFNAGLIVLMDQSGAADLATSKVYLSLAYPIQRGRSTISIGVQPGYVQKFYNSDELTYPSQFDNNTGYFNSELESYEDPNEGRNISYFDINAGINWQFQLPKFKPSLGFAIFHITQPTESFTNSAADQEANRLRSRQVIHGNAIWNLKKLTYLRPSFAYHDQNTASMLLMGSDIGKHFKSNSMKIREVFAGCYYRSGFNRNSDAIIPVFGFQYAKWRFGWSYDVNISQLDVATESKGAFEISIIYTAANSLPKHTSIPCDRY